MEAAVVSGNSSNTFQDITKAGMVTKLHQDIQEFQEIGLHKIREGNWKMDKKWDWRIHVIPITTHSIAWLNFLHDDFLDKTSHLVIDSAINNA